MEALVSGYNDEQDVLTSDSREQVALTPDCAIVDTPRTATAQLHEETPIDVSPSESAIQINGARNNIQTNHKVNKARWLGLVFICLLMTAEYYSIDIPAALHQELKDYLSGPPSSAETGNTGSTFELRFNLLYTVYSMPNMLLPLAGGFLVDQVGPTYSMIGYSLCIWLGQTLFAIGLAQKSWLLMLLGRTVFGVGGESICVANSTLLSEWFDPTERAFAFGTLLAISRLGSVLNNVVSPTVAHAFVSPCIAAWIGVLLNTGGVAAACFVSYLDASMKTPTPHGEEASNDLTEPLIQSLDNEATTILEDYLEMEVSSVEPTTRTSDGLVVGLSTVEDDTPHLAASESVSLTDVGRLSSTFWLLCICCMVVYGCIMPFNNVASGILLERNYFQPPPEDCVLEFPRQCTSGNFSSTNDPYSNPSLNNHGKICPGHGFAPVLPTLPLINISHASYNPETDTKVSCDKSFWKDDCTSDYCNALHTATETAGRAMSIPYAVSAILSPPIGRLVDRIGRRAILAFLCSLTLMMVHLVLAFVPSSDAPLWLPLVGQGIAYALFSAVIWPSVAMVVEKKMTGTAYGIILSMQNTGLALFPLLVATIYKNSNQRYLPNVELLFSACAAIGSIAGALLYILDRRNGYKLNRIGVEENESL